MLVHDVKNRLMNLYKFSSRQELIVDDVVIQTGIDRLTVISAMKSMTLDGTGKFVSGRKGGRSRFVFGDFTNDDVVDERTMLLSTALKRLIDKKFQTNPDQQIIIFVDDLKGKFQLKEILGAFRLLEKEELGLFIPGRKGAKSRFEVGRKREDKIRKTSSGSEYDLPSPNDGPFSEEADEDSEIDESESPNIGYVLRVNDKYAFLLSDVKGGHTSINEAIRAHKCFNNIEDLTEIKSQLIHFGYFVV